MRSSAGSPIFPMMEFHIVLLFLAAGPIVGGYSVGPFLRASAPLPKRFALDDLLYLAVYVQIALVASVSMAPPSVPLRDRMPAAVAFCVGLVLVWAALLGIAQDFGTAGLKKGAFFLVLMPAALANMLVVVGLPVWLTLLQILPSRALDDSASGLTSGLAIAAMLFGIAIPFALRRTAFWIARPL